MILTIIVKVVSYAGGYLIKIFNAGKRTRTIKGEFDDVTDYVPLKPGETLSGFTKEKQRGFFKSWGNKYSEVEPEK